jgi:glycosyltransferase involved in cell wall biosynthesis
MTKKINVVNIINSFEIGGAEILLRDFAAQCDDADIDLSLIYLHGKGTLLKGHKINARVYDLSQNGKFTFVSLFKLIFVLRKIHASILHTHDPQSGIIGRVASLFSGVRHVITTRHNPILVGNHPWVYAIENWFLGRVEKVVAISNAVKYQIVEAGIVKEDKVVVIYNGIDVKDFSPSVKKVLAGGRIRLGSVGRLNIQKGYDILLQSLYILQHEYQCANVDLYIAGEGNQKDSLLALREELGLQEHVTLLGGIENRDRLKEFYEETDIFVLPSRWEGFGISIVEAMAMKKPVIASSIDGVLEIIEDGYNGILCPPADPIALAKKLYEAISSRDVRDSIAGNARHSVEERFTIERYARDLVGLYKEVDACAR